MVKVTWFGRAGLQIETRRYNFIVNPWTDGNHIRSFKRYNGIQKNGLRFGRL